LYIEPAILVSVLPYTEPVHRCATCCDMLQRFLS